MAIRTDSSWWSRSGEWLNAAADSAFSWAERHLLAVTLVSFLLMLLLTIMVTPFDSVLREDAWLYLRKAFEITAGDWTPTHTHFFGWSILEAIVIKVLGVGDIFRAMSLVRFTSLALMCLSVFPLAYLTRRVLGPRPAIFTVLAFALFPPMIRLAPIAYADPLFLFLVLSCAAVLAIPQQHMTKLLIAAALAGLAYHVRANGIFLLIMLLIWTLSESDPARSKVKRAIAVLAIFFAVSAPHLYLRYATYGSPFDYGEASKYFVDSYRQVWDGTVAAPSLWEYLTTHGMADYIDKFIVGGVFKVAGKFALYLGPLWAPLLLTLTIVRCAFSRDERWRLRVPLLFVLFPLAGLVPVFDIFDCVRYFAPIAPFALLLSIATLMRLIGKEKFSGLMAMAFLLVLIAQPVLEVSRGRLQLMNPTLARPQVQDEWAHWAAQNLSGSIAIVEGGDLIGLSELAAKGGNAEHLSSLGAGREMFRPSDYSSLATAYQEFRERKVDYVLIDDANSARRPFLREVYEPVWADRFVLIKSFRSDPTDRGVIKDMDVFRVVY